MSSDRYGDIDGQPIDRATVRLSGSGSVSRRLAEDLPVALIVYGHAGLPNIKRNADDELIREHPIKPAYIAELTPELLEALAGKRKTHTILDAVRDVYDGTQGIARLPMDDEELELEEDADE